MRRHRADAKTAAMEIENGLVLRRMSGRDPFAIDATGGNTLARDRYCAASESRVPVAAHLGHRRVADPAAIDGADALDREIDRGRRNILTCARHAIRPIPC